MYDVIASRGRGQRPRLHRNPATINQSLITSRWESGTRMRCWAFPWYRIRPGCRSRAHRRSWRSCRCRSLRRCWTRRRCDCRRSRSSSGRRRRGVRLFRSLDFNRNWRARLKEPNVCSGLSRRCVGIKSEVVQCAETNRISVLVLRKRLAVPRSRRETRSEDPRDHCYIPGCFAVPSLVHPGC